MSGAPQFPVKLTASLLLIAASGAHADVYLESFPGGSGNNPFNSINWNAYQTATAADVSGTSTDMLVSNAIGLGGVVGYGAKTSLSVGLAWTSEFGSFALADVTNISFYSNHTNTTDAVRIALRLDNNTPGNSADDFWVATNTGFIRNSGTAGSSLNWVANGELENFTFTLAASSWRDLTFVPGSSLSLAASARALDLPTGNVNAAGLYMSLASNVNSPVSGVIRVDDFQVITVPEPGSALLLALGSLGFCGRRFRSRG